MSQDEWTARHVALMRTQRGHWCFVPGCTGSQPLMWVPTAAEVAAESAPRGRAVDLPPPRPRIVEQIGRHVHWARPGGGWR